MTTIIGVVIDGTAWLSADSCMTTGGEYNIRPTSKIIKKSGYGETSMLIASAGSLRFSQFLETWIIPGFRSSATEEEILESPRRWLLESFIPLLCTAMKEENLLEADDTMRGEHGFILAFMGTIWRIEANFSLFNGTRNFDAIGSGSDYAIGAWSLMSLYGAVIGGSPVEKLTDIMRVCADTDLHTREPFTFANTRDGFIHHE